MEESDEFDLNIDNYSFEDMLHLFDIPHDYTLADLKKALKIVAKLHPDRSDIHEDYFIFFHSVYKILLNFYKIKSKNGFREDYYNDSEKVLLDKFSKKKNFNKLFNELFEENANLKKTDGYGTWLKEETIVDDEIKNENLNTYFDKKHNELVKINSIKESNFNSGTCLVENNNYYCSDLFSKLKYDDVKEVYSETFIPVSNKISGKFRTAEELKRFRSETIENPFDDNKSNEILRNKHKEEEYENMQQIFDLFKSDEEHKKNKKKWWTNFKKLTI